MQFSLTRNAGLMHSEFKPGWLTRRRFSAYDLQEEGGAGRPLGATGLYIVQGSPMDQRTSLCYEVAGLLIQLLTGYLAKDARKKITAVPEFRNNVRERLAKWIAGSVSEALIDPCTDPLELLHHCSGLLISLSPSDRAAVLGLATLETSGPRPAQTNLFLTHINVPSGHV